MTESKNDNLKKENKDTKSGSQSSKGTSSGSGSKGSGNKRGSAAKKAQEAAKSKQMPQPKKNPAGSELRDNVVAVVLVALGIFLLFSLITEITGVFGEVMKDTFLGLFGLAAYILPFYLILYALFVLMGRMAHINSRTVLWFVLMYLDFTVIESAFYSDLLEGSDFGAEYIGDMYAAGILYESAGAVGMTAGWLLNSVAGIVGLVIFGIALLVICLLLIIDTPVSVFFDALREKKNDKRIAELAEAKAREQAQKEAEKEARKNARLKKQEPTEEGSTPSTEEQLSLPEGTSIGELNAAEAGNEKTAGETEEKNSGFAGLKIKGAGLFKSKDSKTDKTNPDLDNLPDNKKQIIDYMNDDNLFGNSALGGEKKENWFKNADKKTSDDDYYYEFTSEGSGYDYGDAEKPAGTGENDKAGEPIPAVGEEKAPAAASAVSEPAEASGVIKPETAAADKPAPDAPDKQESEKKPTRSETRAAIEAGAQLLDEQISQQPPQEKTYRLPSTALLNPSGRKENANEVSELKSKAARLEQVLHDFGVNASVIDVKRGPSVTRYEIQPATGVKVSSITKLADDIALNLEARSLRIEAPIPGKAAVGIEIENESSVTVSFRDLLESDAFKQAKSKISFAVGEDISGNAVVADLKGMPHLLIAGSTGSGKSVCINSIIMSMLYNATPDEVRFILIDPKVVELGNYNGIPHMLIPVVTDPAKAAAALAWAVQEMNNRYKKFADSAVRDLKSYNEKMKSDGFSDRVMPQIVIIIDELADLMMAASKQVEESICRLAQLARAAGMHLIVATQRPSVDVVTGLIKANIPSRIAFAVSSQVDSRTILDRAGAEKLVGKGDMLFHPLGKAQAERLQGPFVTDEEVNRVIDFWKDQAGTSDMAARILAEINSVKTEYADGGDDDDEDDLLDDAIELVVDSGQASASMLQRRFRIGYNRAGRLIDIMEARGIIGPSEGSKPRRVLISKEEYQGRNTDSSEFSEQADDAYSSADAADSSAYDMPEESPAAEDAAGEGFEIQSQDGAEEPVYVPLDEI